MLYENTEEGDFQVKALRQLKELEVAADQCQIRNDQTKDSFLAAVSSLDNSRLRTDDDETELTEQSDQQIKTSLNETRPQPSKRARSIFKQDKPLRVNDGNDDNCSNYISTTKDENNPNCVNTVIIKMAPDCLVPSLHPSVHLKAKACVRVVKVHLYAFCGVLSHPNSTHSKFVQSCSSCSSHLTAASSCGMAFLNPLPTAMLTDPMQFGLRGSNMNVQLEYLGEKDLVESEMLAMQMFHRSILCWETDGSLSPSAPGSSGCVDSVPFEKPLSVEDWSRSNYKAWYIVFPLMHSLQVSNTDTASSIQSHIVSRNSELRNQLENERRIILSATGSYWLDHLQKCAMEARKLVDNLYYHQYRYDKVTDDTTKLGSGGTDIESIGTTSKSMKFPLLYNHKREDLVGQLFSRDKECIYVGVEDVQEGGEINSALTFDDVMREGKHKVREGKSSGQVANDRDSPTLDETYLQYYLSKGRLTMERADAMRESNSKCTTLW